MIRKLIQLQVVCLLLASAGCKTLETGANLLDLNDFQSGIRAGLAGYYPEAMGFAEVKVTDSSSGVIVQSPFADYEFVQGPEDRVKEQIRSGRWSITRTIPPSYLAADNKKRLYDAFRHTFVGDEWLHSSHRDLRGLEPELYDPQLIALEAFDASYEKDRAGLISLPTGVGKTVTAAFAIKGVLARNPQARIAFLAHQGELLANAQKTVLSINPELQGKTAIYQGMGRDAADFETSRVVFAGIQSLARDIGGLSLTNYDLVIVDEAHRIESASYQLIVDENPHYILGLSATPFRADKRDPLNSLAGNLLFGMSPKEAIQQGYLVRPDFHLFSLQTNLAGEEESPTAAARAARRLMQTEQGVAAMLPVLSRFHDGERTVAFYPNKNEAGFWNDKFRALGVESELFIGGSQSRNDREQRKVLLESFASDNPERPKLLATVNLMLEGVDVPAIRKLILHRRFSSMTALMQAIGRGLRVSPGKRRCEIGDFLFNHATAVEAFTLLQFLESQFGIPIELITGDEENIYDEDEEEVVFDDEGKGQGEVTDSHNRRTVDTLTGTLRVDRRFVDILQEVIGGIRNRHRRRDYSSLAHDINEAAEVRLYEAFDSRASLARFVGVDRQNLVSKLRDPNFQALLTEDARLFINRKQRVAADINDLANSDSADKEAAFKNYTTLAKAVAQKPPTLTAWLKDPEFLAMLEEEAKDLLKLEREQGASHIINHINILALSGELEKIKSTQELARSLGYSNSYVGIVIREALKGNEFNYEARRILVSNGFTGRVNINEVAAFLNDLGPEDLALVDSRAELISLFGAGVSRYYGTDEFFAMLEPAPRRTIMSLSNRGKRLLVVDEIEALVAAGKETIYLNRARLIKHLTESTPMSNGKIRILLDRDSQAEVAFWLLLRPSTADELNLDPRAYLTLITEDLYEDKNAPNTLDGLAALVETPVDTLRLWLSDRRFIEQLREGPCILVELYLGR